MQDNHLLKMEISNNELVIKISIENLVWLFHQSPNNFNGEGRLATIKPKEGIGFTKFIIDFLKSDNQYDENNTNWGQPLEDAFSEIMEGDESFCDYDTGNLEED